MIGSFALGALILLLIVSASSVRSEAISEYNGKPDTGSGATSVGWGKKK
ncbi:hypothetical protein PUR_43300 [Paenibacillus sp. URB8-2]|nr:hypothetical protein PUR_43300 [Paenibacillus sp. URB8-2]